MPRYKMNVVIEYDAKREVAWDRQAAILDIIDAIPHVRAICEDDAEELLDQAPTQPDESGS